MSGTSLDGLDISLCKYYRKDKRWAYEFLDFECIPYSIDLVKKIRNVYDTSARKLVETDIELATYLGEKIAIFIENCKFSVDLIASHGQTIFHVPEKKYTCQIGSGAVIAAITGLPVISDFRQQDITLGGQGAPLVPIGDELLFGEYAACLNLGGFANISYNKDGRRLAFDICAVNFVLNHFARKKNLEYDCDGKLASEGSVNNELLDKLNDLDFYKKTSPKSLGQEWVENSVFPLMNNYKELTAEDLLRTYSEHICFQISKAFLAFAGEKVLVTGGGTKNSFIMERIRELSEKKIIIPDNNLIDFKEAIVFGFLGVLRFKNEINCLASVTGAKRDSCTGALYLP